MINSRGIYIFSKWVFQRLSEETSWRADLVSSDSPAEQNTNITPWSEYSMELQSHKIVVTSFIPTSLIKSALKTIYFYEIGVAWEKKLDNVSNITKDR